MWMRESQIHMDEENNIVDEIVRRIIDMELHSCASMWMRESPTHMDEEAALWTK
jgi:hypothetical protein